MSWCVAGLSLLHFQIKHNYHPKARALMTPRLTFQTLDHTRLPWSSRKFSRILTLWRKRLKRPFCLFGKSWFFLKGLHSTTGRSVTTEKKQRQSFLTAPLSTHRENRKKARKGLMELVWSFPHSAPGFNTLGQPGRGEQPRSSQLCLSCNSPSVPLCFCIFRSGKVFGEAVLTLPLILERES